MIKYFTRRGYQNQLERASKLQEELRKLESQLGDAHEGGGGWHDNASFDHINHQIRIANRRLREAADLLKDAEIIEYPPQNGIVRLGSRVRVLFDGEERTYQVVAYGEVNLDERKIAYDAPLAKAMAGRREGDVTKFEISGETNLIEILEISPIQN